MKYSAPLERKRQKPKPFASGHRVTCSQCHELPDFYYYDGRDPNRKCPKCNSVGSILKKYPAREQDGR